MLCEGTSLTVQHGHLRSTTAGCNKGPIHLVSASIVESRKDPSYLGDAHPSSQASSVVPFYERPAGHNVSQLVLFRRYDDIDPAVSRAGPGLNQSAFCDRHGHTARMAGRASKTRASCLSNVLLPMTSEDDSDTWKRYLSNQGE